MVALGRRLLALSKNLPGNEVAGNLIGVNAAGDATVPNNANGIVINGAPQNLIGGRTAAAGNLIAGNGRDAFWKIVVTRSW